MTDLSEMVEWLRGVANGDLQAAKEACQEAWDSEYSEFRWRTTETFVHILRHDPADTIARCKAELALIDDILSEKHVVVDGDCWFTCPAATEDRDGGESCNDLEAGRACDCGRDSRVERRIGLLAAAYRHRDGYKAEWRRHQPL